MDLTTAKKDLLSLAARMQGVATTRSTMPILAQVLLAADGAVLRLAATDLYLALAGEVTADVTKTGSVSVGAKELVERVKLMPDGPIRITTDGRQLTMRAAGSARKYVLPASPGEEFPPLPTPADGASVVTVAASVLVGLVDRVAYAISPDESRPHLNSTRAEWRGSTLRLVATDGHRLSWAEATTGAPAELDLQIPLSAIRALRRFCEDAGDATLSLSCSSSSVMVRGEDSTVFSFRQSDGVFPPYQQVIPAVWDHEFRVARSLLVGALRAVAVTAADTGPGAGMNWELNDGKLVMTAKSAAVGDAVDAIDIDYSGKKTLRYRMEPRYMLDVLESMEDEDIALRMSGEMDPIVALPVKGSAFFGLVMPMRLVG